MIVKEAMSAPAISVPRTATVRQAIRVLHDHQITAAPVVGGDGRLVGIVSEMDLLRGEFEHDPRAFVRRVATPDDPPPRWVAEVMTEDVRTARLNGDVREVAEMMMATRIKSVPVLDGQQLVGMLSRRDLLAVLARGDARIRDDVHAALTSLVPDAADWEVRVLDGVVELRGGSRPQAEPIPELLARTVPGVVRVVVTDETAQPDQGRSRPTQ
ncbi:CBS domain-containing protein [Spirillospora sp. NPDC047279]|uniref:CBS domain-containing protein n=1 Tax=Spirillospora sp. NPDC047279 TaxID=3155478 RepID=UPI003410CF35